MLRRLLMRLDAFEDDPIAPVVGVMILALVTFAMLIAPLPGEVVAQ